jgi:membrane peptidoglycan carboxypeptidase
MKSLYIREERRGQVSPWRRFEQAALSSAYERRHTKEEVLTAYLNTVYFGDGAYGAEEAAKKYFGKSASELELAEAATLAGFLHAPSTYSPRTVKAPNSPTSGATRSWSAWSSRA